MKYTTTSGKTLNINDKDEINRGGEGKIMLVKNHPDIVAKIFHNPQDNSLENKLLHLKKLDANVFVTPQEILYQNNKLVGYTMQFLGSDFFAISTIFSKNFCQKEKIDFDFKKTIAEKLRKAVENAHQNGIIIGDLNQFNILVNLNKDIKIIDTDSFETPTNQHSDVLLEDIRDYLYNGNVNKNSDYFALSVILFYMLTFTHPFKGIHTQYKSLRERMINKLPVFVNSPDLKVPNCYVPINDNDVNSLFKKHYIDGERFLISLENTKLTQTATSNVVLTTKIDEKHITVTPILQNTKIVDVVFNDELGYVETEKEFIVYEAKHRGYLSRKHVIKTSEFDEIFIGNNNILLRKKQKLYHYKNEQEIIEIKNFEISKRAEISIKENILIVIEDDVMFWLYVDEIFNGSIKSQRYEVFGKGFSQINGLIQNTGGIKRLFYNSGTTISSIKVDKNVKAVYQTKNAGVLQYIENKKVEHRFFVIRGNNVYFSDEELEDIVHFGFMPTVKDEGLIFEPSNGAINIIRTEDFKAVSKMDCSIINPHTSLKSCKSGILAYDDKNMFLVNSK
ncbi:MAG: hypothetical protein JXL97_13560 [Bacteroidales bacterium]|nr:hypothetical protein [Bacteroidales bacterium]